MKRTDAKLLGQVYAVLLEYGAASTERIMTTLGPSVWARDIQWACYHLKCAESGGMWILPDTMLPLGWESFEE